MRHRRAGGKAHLEHPSHELEAVGEELERHAHADAPEHACGLRAALFGSDENLGTGHPLGVGKAAVLPLDQEAAKRDHGEDADQPAAHGEERDLEPLRIQTPDEEGRNGEQHAGGDRGTRGADRLRHVRFEDAVLKSERLEYPEGHDREHGHRDRRADRQTGLQAEIRIGRAEDHPEDYAGGDRLERELRKRLAGRQRDEFLTLFKGVRCGRQLPAAHMHSCHSVGSALNGVDSGAEGTRPCPRVNNRSLRGIRPSRPQRQAAHELRESVRVAPGGRPRENAPVVLFDGWCPLCVGAVRFLIRKDRAALFRFAPLESAPARTLLETCQADPEDRLAARTGTTVALVDRGRLYVRSDAALRIAARLPLPWRSLVLLRVVPRGLRDRAYGRSPAAGTRCGEGSTPVMSRRRTIATGSSDLRAGARPVMRSDDPFRSFHRLRRSTPGSDRRAAAARRRPGYR